MDTASTVIGAALKTASFLIEVGRAAGEQQDVLRLLLVSTTHLQTAQSTLAELEPSAVLNPELMDAVIYFTDKIQKSKLRERLERRCTEMRKAYRIKNSLSWPMGFKKDVESFNDELVQLLKCVTESCPGGNQVRRSGLSCLSVTMLSSSRGQCSDSS